MVPRFPLHRYHEPINRHCLITLRLSCLITNSDSEKAKDSVSARLAIYSTLCPHACTLWAFYNVNQFRRLNTAI